MTGVYRISPHQAEIERKNSVIRSSIFLAVVIIAMGLFTPAANGINAGATLLFVLFIAVIYVVILLITIRSTKRIVQKAVASFELELSDDSITKQQADTQSVTIAFNEITAVEQYSRKGTRLKTAQSSRHIWVPCELEQYAELIELVKQRSGVALKTQSYSWARTYSISVVMLVAWITLMNAHDRRLILTLSAALSVALVWSVVSIWRNPNASRRLKRNMLLVLLPVLTLIARFASAW